MTYEEAGTLLGPDECDRLAQHAADAPPLSEDQGELLVALFRPATTTAQAA